MLGLSAVQLDPVFFRRPAQGLIQLLAGEAIVRMSLESRSLRLALARYHLTAPDALRPDEGSGHRAELLQRQLDILAEMDRADFEAIEKLGGPVSAPESPPAE